MVIFFFEDMIIDLILDFQIDFDFFLFGLYMVYKLLDCNKFELIVEFN